MLMVFNNSHPPPEIPSHINEKRNMESTEDTEERNYGHRDFCAFRAFRVFRGSCVLIKSSLPAFFNNYKTLII